MVTSETNWRRTLSHASLALTEPAIAFQKQAKPERLNLRRTIRILDEMILSAEDARHLERAVFENERRLDHINSSLRASTEDSYQLRQEIRNLVAGTKTSTQHKLITRQAAVSKIQELSIRYASRLQLILELKAKMILVKDNQRSLLDLLEGSYSKLDKLMLLTGLNPDQAALHRQLLASPLIQEDWASET